MLFTETIDSWVSWGEIFQSIEVFEPVIREICRKEGLTYCQPENCTPGSNAVFRSGNKIFKIYAPTESGVDTYPDYQAELFGLSHAEKWGIWAPGLVCTGYLEDRYRFNYLVMDYVPGTPFGEIRDTLSEAERDRVGAQIKGMIARLNHPVAAFNSVNWVERAYASPKWTGFTEGLTRERTHFLRSIAGYKRVYVHGDITADNVLYLDGKLCLIDFADGCQAPPEYELGPVITDLFRFDPACLSGFCGREELTNLADRLMSGLLIHYYGGSILQAALPGVSQLDSLEQLRQRLLNQIKVIR